MAELIKYWEIPGDGIKPEEIRAAALNLRTTADGVRDNGATTVSAWSGLSAHYTSPDDETLFAVMTPVGPSTTSFGDNLDTATGALEDFADDVEPIKATLAAIKLQAEAFYGRVKNGVTVEKKVVTGHQAATVSEEKEWHEDQDTVDENNDYIRQTNDAMVRLWEAERKAANKIRAIYGADPLVADATGEGGKNTYMYESIPEGTDTPWGSKQDRTESCGEATARTVFVDFLWEGIAVGGVWGTITGLGGLISYNSQTGEWGDWNYAGSAWKNLAQLVTGITGLGNPVSWVTAALPGPAGDWQRESYETALNAAKGMIAWGEWEENPGAAAGKTVFNVGTILIPAGAAVTGIKGGSLAGKLATAAKVTELVDGGALLKLGGSGLKLGSKALTDLLGDLKLGTKMDLPDFSNLDVDVSTVSKSDVDDLGSTPRDTGAETTPVQERELVGSDGSTVHVGGETGGSGSHSGGGDHSGGGSDQSGGGDHSAGGDQAAGTDPLDPHDGNGADPIDSANDISNDSPEVDYPVLGDGNPVPPPGDPARTDIIRDDPGSLLAAEQRAAVDEYLQQSKDAEPTISRDMEDIRSAYPDSHPEGWDFRLKETDSLYRKVVMDMDANALDETAPDLPFDQIVDNMRDTVRYTNATDASTFTETTHAQIQELVDRGYENITFKNTFGSDGYQGINTTWRAPDGTAFEVQFHTPESFEAKTVTHGLYEQQRTLPIDDVVGRDALKAEQQAIFDTVETPDGARDLTWDDFARRGEEEDLE